MMPYSLENGIKKRRRKAAGISLCLCVFLALVAGLSLMLGNTFYEPLTVLRVLSGTTVEGATFAILTLRLPRMLAGTLVGLGFGMAGHAFQTMLRNPLASPDIIGVTTGASVAAVFCILVLKISGPLVSILALFVGLGVAFLIYALASGGHFSGGRLILIGIGIQAILSAIISYLLLKASQYDVPAAMRWLRGSLNGIRMESIYGLLTVCLLFGTILLVLDRPLQMMALGEETAVAVGVNAKGTRILTLISALFLIAYGTAVTGPIAFVSFLAGPIAKRLTGNSAYQSLVAALVGALLVLISDLVGQFAFGSKFPVGIITGILGAPYLLYLLIRMNRSGGSL